jgi:hypothetical protein
MGAGDIGAGAGFTVELSAAPDGDDVQMWAC